MQRNEVRDSFGWPWENLLGEFQVTHDAKKYTLVIGCVDNARLYLRLFSEPGILIYSEQPKAGGQGILQEFWGISQQLIEKCRDCAIRAQQMKAFV